MHLESQFVVFIKNICFYIKGFVMYRFLTLFLILSSFSMSAENAPYPGIRDLDAVLSEHQEITRARVSQIESRKYLLVKTDSMEERYRICDSLFHDYSSFQLDSALSYAGRKLNIAKELGQRKLIDRSVIEIANMYIKAGMNMQSYDMLQHIDRSQLDNELLQEYYSINNNLYEFLSQFALNRSARSEYRKMAKEYRDSVLMHEPDDIFVYTYSLLSEEQYEKGLGILLDYFGTLDPSQREIGPAAYSISEYYRAMGDVEAEKRYLIISSVSDIRHGVKEYCSLTRLATILYEEGDYERAHRYIEVSLNDAVFGDAKMRTLEVTDILPIIETDYQQRLKTQRTVLIYALSGISLLLVLLMFILVRIRRYQKQLDAANVYVKNSNDLLKESNRLLAESGAIKNVYIFNLMMECVNRIENFDHYRRTLNKKAISGDRNSVFAELKSPDVIEHEWQSFYEMFDRTFLQLFPSFVQDVNGLLRPEEWFVGIQEYSLPVELRIFALIRLGIAETERIATLLRYSRSTIYAYRSRTRLKALQPELFESQIMEISSI